MSYFQPYLPSTVELAALLACIVVMVGFLAIGTAIGRPRHPGPGALLGGWGVVACLPALGQWLGPVNLQVYAIAVGAAAAGAAVWHRHALAASPLWRPAVLMAPALVVACGVPLDQWDSFSHWGINTAWLWRHDTLPSPSLPVSPSSNPDYPYAYPLALYFASMLRGAYIDNAGAIVNLLVLVGVSASVARLASGDDPQRLEARPWFWSAWGVLAVLVLNPGLLRSSTLATYADTVFAACLLALCLALWRLADTHRRDAGRWLTTAALGLALVGVKESGVLALVVIAVAVVIVAARDAVTRAGLWPMLGALLPAAIAGVAWHQYTAGWLPSSFSILALDQWRFDLLPALARSVLDVVADHGFYYLLLAVVVALGARGWWRSEGRVDRLLAFSALVVLGHLATMLLAYLGASFTEAEVAGAASFHRYATQVGLLALGALVLAAGHRAAVHGGRDDRAGRVVPGRWLVAVCVAVMIAGSPYLHRERNEFETYFLRHGRLLADRLPEGSRVGLLGWQALPYAYFLLRYEFFRPGRGDRGLELERIFEPLADAGAERRRQLKRLAARRALSHVLIIGEGLQGRDGPDMLLLARDGTTWRHWQEWRSE